MNIIDDIQRQIENQDSEKKEKGYEGKFFHINPYERLEKKEFIKNLGRNDKCMCGSGKKLKKCCLHNLNFENIYELKENKMSSKKQLVQNIKNNDE